MMGGIAQQALKASPLSLTRLTVFFGLVAEAGALFVGHAFFYLIFRRPKNMSRFIP